MAQFYASNMLPQQQYSEYWLLSCLFIVEQCNELLLLIMNIILTILMYFLKKILLFASINSHRHENRIGYTWRLGQGCGYGCGHNHNINGINGPIQNIQCNWIVKLQNQQAILDPRPHENSCHWDGMIGQLLRTYSTTNQLNNIYDALIKSKELSRKTYIVQVIIQWLTHW